MKRMTLLVAGGFIAFVGGFAGPVFSSDSAVSASFGGHYWRTIDDLGTSRDFDRDGLAWTASVRFNLSRWIGAEGGVEVLPEGFLGADERIYAPNAMLVVGRALYLAGGVGAFCMDGKFYDDPFYLLRGGLCLDFLPLVSLDLYADYRFTRWDDVESIARDISTETVTVGAGVRLGF